MTPVSRDEHEALRSEVAALRKRLDELHPTVDEHDDRLDDHDTEIGRLGVKFADFSTRFDRLADEVTKQHGSLREINANTKRVLELLEPRTVVVEGE